MIGLAEKYCNGSGQCGPAWPVGYGLPVLVLLSLAGSYWWRRNLRRGNRLDRVEIAFLRSRVGHSLRRLDEAVLRRLARRRDPDA